ncbi:MAG TPA: arsenate reductase ArsC [Stellaceae bacterium]|nr:arsenate reductase ArsC [Stellaceae bacterium]
MSDEIRNVLFLCTHNSARSVLAESILNRLGGRFHAFSAGSFPKGKINPFALELLDTLGYPIDNLRSKSWDEFAGPDAPRIDFVITVCDQAAGEVCPVWPGHPLTAHWGMADPSAVEGSADARRKAFRETFDTLLARIRAFASLQLDGMDRHDLERKMKEIGSAPSAAVEA